MDPPRERLLQLLKQEGNTQCADCFEPNPLWASVNRGVFICTQCAGVHRSLGVKHSFVLSCTLDEWKQEQVDNMALMGNASVNERLEYCVPKSIEVPYRSDTDRDTRATYIRAKYVDNMFCASPGGQRRPPERVARKKDTGGSESNRLSNSQVAMVEFIGIVDVTLVECRQLVVKDLVSSDPYCVMTLGMQTRKSTVKYSNLNPVYNERFSFSWDGIGALVIDLFDEDDLSKDDDLGTLTVDLTPLLMGEGVELKQWYPILNRQHPDKNQGEIFLHITYIPIQNS
eukprot:Em0013g310a